MNIACIRHSQIPGASPLFLDLLYRFDRVSHYYPHPPTLERAPAIAESIDFPAERRQALVEALRDRNALCGPSTQEALARLAEPETVVVATGQQVGLFGGPVFALYKALTAAKHAAWLTEQGRPAVAVFWLATEDHDLAEIDHARVLDAENQTRTVRAATESAPDQPAGRARVTDFGLDQLREALEGLDFADETLELVREAYAESPTFGDSFATLFARLLEPYGVILLDPLAPGIRRLAAPLVRKALERNGELNEALRERGAELEDDGYHAQVQVSDETSLLFLLDKQRRKVLRRATDGDSGFQAGGASYTLDELVARLDADPEAFSPNALLRPVIQDWLLPTVAFVAGPSELAYLAQSAVIYERLLGRAPVFLPRASFTLFDHRRRKLLERHRLAPSELFVPADDLRRRIGRSLTPPEVLRGVELSRKRIETAVADLDRTLSDFDPTLAEALGRSRKKMLYQVGKISSKIEREAVARDEQAERETEGLAAWTYPHRNPQERYYGILPFLARFGPRLSETVYEAIRHDCPDHQALAL